MDRRDFLSLAAQVSAMMVLLRESVGLASANNLTQATQQTPTSTEAQPAPLPEPPSPQPISEAPFSEEWFQDMARTLAATPSNWPQVKLPEELRNLDYDGYRAVRFKKDSAIWAKDKVDTSLELFQAGYIFQDLVKVHLVEDGVAREFPYSSAMFEYGPKGKPPPENAPGGFSGFRIHGPINRPDVLDEYVVFQGASYFRSFASGQEYGISARGLAVNTAQMPGEEFPIFRSFWVVKPKKGDEFVIVYALLDSKSVTGAYKFTISHRTDTMMEIDCTLHPRLAMPYVGIAPLTSMFHSGPSDVTKYTDYRPQVFDSQGLQMWNGGGEHLWRPLINPERLQFSSFSDENPKGFGLITRDRNFNNYQDLQVRYDKRPSAWVEPLSDWGAGFVDLIELPTPTEYNDNIVAFWRPKEPLQPGQVYRYRYKLHWCWDAPLLRNFAFVSQTRISTPLAAGWHSFHLDFKGTENFNLCSENTDGCADKGKNVQLSASAGVIGQTYFQRNLVTGGHRLSFDFRTKGLEQADIRCVLNADGVQASEIWTYRWTA
ncbi:MAG: glucan biosynthesis protein [Hyphomicrobiales bacterium]|nr:glucan biosynthesis protein [Hyphomicrobiales bacterium]